MIRAAWLCLILSVAGCIGDDPPPGTETADGDASDYETERGLGGRTSLELEAHLTNCTNHLTFIRTPKGTIETNVPEEWRYTTVDDLHIFDAFICTRMGWNGAEAGPAALVFESTSIKGPEDNCFGPATGIIQFVHAIYGNDQPMIKALGAALGVPEFFAEIKLDSEIGPAGLMGRLGFRPEGSPLSSIEALWPMREPNVEGQHTMQYMHTNKTHTAMLTLDSTSTWISTNEYHGTGQFHEPVVASRSPAPLLPLTVSFYFDFNASGVAYTWNEPLCGA